MGPSCQFAPAPPSRSSSPPSSRPPQRVLRSGAPLEPERWSTRSVRRMSAPAASGAAVLDLSTGRAVFTHNPSLPLLPASNEKLAVTYAALTALGPAFRIETDVLGEGRQVGTLWTGNIVLKGYGDPTLSSAGLASLARQVRAAGITRVAGRVVGDETWFDAQRTSPGWKAAFYIEESPPLSALIVDRGRVGRWTSHNPALAAAQLFRKALVRVGVRIAGGAVLGAVAADGDHPRLDRLADARRDRRLHGSRERQLHRRDAREGARSGADRPGHDGRGSRRRHRPARRRRTCRCRASGSSTAPGSRCSTA